MKKIVTTKDSTSNRTVVSIQLYNLPLAIFYGIIIFLWFLFVFKVISLGLVTNEKVQWGIFLPIVIVLFYLTVKSLFGKANFIIDAKYVYLYEGVFGMGIKRRVNKRDIKRIYVRRIENGDGVDGHYQPQAREIKQFIIVEALKTYKFIHNQIATEDLHHYCDKINEAMKRVPPTTIRSH